MASVNATASSAGGRTYQHTMIFPSTSIFASSTPNSQASFSQSPLQRETTASQSLTQNWNGSLLFDAITSASQSSTSRGGGSTFNESSASLFPSSTAFDTTPGSFSSSSEEYGTSGVLTEDSLDVLSGREVITTTMFGDRHSVQQTTVLPTPASDVFTPVSSVIPPVGDTSAGEAESLKDILIVAVPVGVTFFIVIVILIVLCVRCCRRKKSEGGKAVEEDLWKKADSLQAPVVPMTVLSTSESEPPSTAPTATLEAPSSSDPSSPSNDDDQLLYKVVYEFPGQLDSQLTLTPGDVIEVMAMADHGWLRGSIKGENRSGWFPSSFVVPMNEAGGKTEAAAESGPAAQGGRPRISSFLLRKKPSKWPPQLDNVPSLTHLHSQTSLNKKCRSVAVVTPVSPVKVLDSNPLTAEDFSLSVRDKYFKAMFPYKAAYRGELTLREGEVVVGKERDRNGWMLGRSLTSGQEGWFPSVYVDQVTGDISSASKTQLDAEKGDMTSSSVSCDVYALLDVNRNKSPDQAWVAIEHRVVKPYEAESYSQMGLREGDVVAVVQALDSGWCLGCRGDQLGWFPADHVQLLEEKSEGKMDSFSLLPLCRAPQQKPQPSQHNHDTSQDPAPSCFLDSSQDSLLSEGEKPRPARWAPRPPLLASQGLQGSEGNLSTASAQSVNPRPARPAPAPPSHNARQCHSVGSIDMVESSQGPPRPGDGSTAVGTIRKQRKPRVVRIAKERLGLDKLSSFPEPMPRSPSLASCGSPPVMPPSGFLNIFFLKTAKDPQRPQPSAVETAQEDLDSRAAETVDVTDQEDLDSNVSETVAVPAQEDPDAKVSETVAVIQQSNIVLKESRQDASDGNTLGTDWSESGDIQNTDTQVREGPSGSRDPTEQRASTSAASIAVQTDISDLNNEDNSRNGKDPNDRKSDSEMTSLSATTSSASFPTTNIDSNDDKGSSQDVTERATAGQDFTTNPHQVTNDPDSGLPVQNGQRDNDQDVPPADHPCRQSPTAVDTHNTSSSSETDQSPSAAEQPSSAETEPSNSIPKATPPLPDLLNGTKVPPKPLKPKPTSPDVSDSKPKLSRGSHDPRPQNGDLDKSPKSVRLTPVVQPLSKKESEEEGGDGIVVPAEGLSGRVSMIVNHINRMNSQDEGHPAPRKTSLSLLSPQADLEEATLEALKDGQDPSQERAASPDSSCPVPQQKTGGLSGEEAGWGGVEGGSEANADHQNSAGQVHQTTLVPQAGTSPGDSLQEAPSPSNRQSRGEGRQRPQSSKESRVAPPPPTSPPPPLTRKSQRSVQ
ncbi:hypothetical protein ACOMHN_048020 [Nucella lapillus]